MHVQSGCLIAILFSWRRRRRCFLKAPYLAER